MAKRNGNGAFIFGAILGGAVGAVTALWKTPQSGQELRARLGFESEVVTTATGTAKQVVSVASNSVSAASRSVSAAASSGKPLPAKALSVLESAAAPLVGVKLGQTANNSQPDVAVTAASAPETM